MRLAEVIGMVTLSRPHVALKGFRFVLARPLTRGELVAGKVERTDEVVVYDDLGAGIGSKIAYAESGEAAAPFYPDKKPIDAYCAALIDCLQIKDVTGP